MCKLFLILIGLTNHIQAHYSMGNPQRRIEEDWKFVVSFHYISAENGSMYYFCTGAAISKYLVLTLASCIEKCQISKIKILPQSANFQNPRDFREIAKIFFLSEAENKPQNIVLVSVRPRLRHPITLPSHEIVMTNFMECKTIDWANIRFENDEKAIWQRSMMTASQRQSFWKFWAVTLDLTPIDPVDFPFYSHILL